MSSRRSSKNSLRGRASRKKNTDLRVIFPIPPQINNYGVALVSRRQRYNCLSAFDGEITYQNLLDSILFASTAVVGYNLFIAVRIKFVEIWAQPTPVAVGANSVSLTFNGSGTGYTGDQKVHLITSGGSTMGHVRCVPSKRCFASEFQVSSNNGAFDLTCQVGTIIDVVVDYERPMQPTAVLCQNALVGATTGSVYTRGLDGVALATTKLPSVSNQDI